MVQRGVVEAEALPEDVEVTTARAPTSQQKTLRLPMPVEGTTETEVAEDTVVAVAEVAMTAALPNMSMSVATPLDEGATYDVLLLYMHRCC